MNQTNPHATTPGTREGALSQELQRRLGSYSAAAAALSAVSTAVLHAQLTVNNFQSPYSIPAGTSLTTEGAMAGAVGDWTGSFSGSGSLDSRSLTTPSSPDPAQQVSISLAHGSSSYGTRTYDWSTTANGSGNVSFAFAISSAGSPVASDFIVNNTAQGSLLGGGNFSFAVSAGDVFGFRFTVGYAGGPQGSLTATISSFSGPSVPEPASFPLWMGAGALGLVAIREVRRRQTRRAQS